MIVRRTRERVCVCGATYTQREYQSHLSTGALVWQWTAPKCRACYNAFMLAINKRRYIEMRGEKYRRCRGGCGAPVKSAATYCAACKAAWKCVVCKRSDMPRDAYDMCNSCARTHSRRVKKGIVPPVPK